MTTEAYRQAVLEHLVAMRAALERLCAPPSEELETGCVHPHDRRIDFGGMGVEEWTCRDCGFHARSSLRKDDSHASR